MDLSAYALPTPRIEIPDNANGVWDIPELNITIPVYTAHIKGKSEQAVTDDPDSACITPWGKAYTIGDHYGSTAGKGTWNISKVRPGMLGFFHKPDGMHRYECYVVHLADVKGFEIYSSDGHLIEPHSSKDIACASCVGGDSKRNYLAVFRYKGKEKYT